MPRWYVLSPLSSNLVLTSLFRPAPLYIPPSFAFFSFGSHNGGGGSHTHPCLVTRTILSLVTRAFGLRYFTPDYRGYPHPKRRRPPRHVSKRSCCSRLCVSIAFSPAHDGFYPQLFSCFVAPTSSVHHSSVSSTPYAILMHLISTICICPIGIVIRVHHPPLRAGLFDSLAPSAMTAPTFDSGS